MDPPEPNEQLMSDIEPRLPDEDEPQLPPPPPDTEPRPNEPTTPAPKPSSDAGAKKKVDAQEEPSSKPTQDEWKFMPSVKLALIAAAMLIAAPMIFSALIWSVFAASLSPDDAQALSFFNLAAAVFGAIVAVMMFLYGYYEKGTLMRLLTGLGSGILIMIHSFVVFSLSGLRAVLADVGVQLDTIYVALLITFASIVIMSGFIGEHIAVRRSLQEPEEAQEPEGEEPETA